MNNQYEQLCNAQALKQMGIKVLARIEPDFWEQCRQWLSQTPTQPMSYYQTDNAQGVVENLMKQVKIHLF